ncbi:MAG: helix-turn-helix domain-containing protein [Chitinophagaceae bacterium]|nr:helix-turn-helix domain-containing protein [Chitinophagaceae bacterium]
MKYSALRNTTSLGSQECLSLLPLTGKHFAPDLHYHDEYELTLVEKADNVRFTIGGTTVSPDGHVLILTAPGVPHAFDTSYSAVELSGVVLRWPSDLLAEKFLGKHQLSRIHDLLQKAKQGVLFPPAVWADMKIRLSLLVKKKGFELYLGFLSILHALSTAEDAKTLSPESFAYDPPTPGEGIDSAVAYMKANYSRPISLADVAGKAHMSRGAFCRLIRRKTGKTYGESLNEIRIGHICHMLVGTTENISEIAYKAGYTSIAHFHRSFKRQKGCTPKEYRESLTGRKN